MTRQDGVSPPVCVANIQDILHSEVHVRFTEGYLMNRRTVGVPLRRNLVDRIAHLAEADTLVVDLVGIVEMTTSVAEEIGPMLFNELLAYREKGNEVFIAYCNASKETANGLDAAFRSWSSDTELGKRLTVPVFDHHISSHFSGYHFVGKEIPEALLEILCLIYERGHAVSPDLEEIGIKAASRKLNELYKQYPWLVRRVQRSVDTGSRSWAYYYFPIVPTTPVAEELRDERT